MEFRQHSGTRNANKIRNWILFCLDFVEASREILRSQQAAVVVDAVALDYFAMATQDLGAATIDRMQNGCGNQYVLIIKTIGLSPHKRR